MEGEPHHAFKDVVALGRSLYALVDPYAGLTCPMTYEGNDGRQYLAGKRRRRRYGRDPRKRAPGGVRPASSTL